ncbi:MAG: type II secretion system F family protein [Thermoguttaceae bacterium]
MPEFSYIAREMSGEKVTGTVAADNQRDAMGALASRSLFPIEVRADSPVIEDKRVRRVPAQLLANTYAQLADLLQSGVPLLRALEVLRNQTSHSRLKHVLGQVHRHVEDGSTLSEAMARFERVFGEMPISMVSAGGEGGFLEEALSQVAQFTEAQEDLKKRTIGAMVYPVCLAVFGLLVVTAIMIFLVPKFDVLFARLAERGELPVLTTWLLWSSAALGRWGPWMLIAAAGGVWYLRRWVGTETGRLWKDRTKLWLPVIGPIFLNLAVARFCRVLGTLLRSGVPILRSLDISSVATVNRVLTAAIGEATENISAGQTLAKPLDASGQFPPTVIEMIAVAEQSNNLENVLLTIADNLERNTWRRLDLAVRMIEPILLASLAAVVLVVVIALLLPMMRMSQTL